MLSGWGGPLRISAAGCIPELGVHRFRRGIFQRRKGSSAMAVVFGTVSVGDFLQEL